MEKVKSWILKIPFYAVSQIFAQKRDQMDLRFFWFGLFFVPIQLLLLSSEVCLWFVVWALEMLHHGGAAASPCPGRCGETPPRAEQLSSPLVLLKAATELNWHLPFYLKHTSFYFTPSVKDIISPRSTQFALFRQWRRCCLIPLHKVSRMQQLQLQDFFFPPLLSRSWALAFLPQHHALLFSLKQKQQKRKIKRKKQTDLKEDH